LNLPGVALIIQDAIGIPTGAAAIIRAVVRKLDSRYEGAEIGDIPSRALLLGPLPLRWLFYRKFQRKPGHGAQTGEQIRLREDVISSAYEALG
jgi:hypothetical protein